MDELCWPVRGEPNVGKRACSLAIIALPASDNADKPSISVLVQEQWIALIVFEVFALGNGKYLEG